MQARGQGPGETNSPHLASLASQQKKDFLLAHEEEDLLPVQKEDLVLAQEKHLLLMQARTKIHGNSLNRAPELNISENLISQSCWT